MDVDGDDDIRALAVTRRTALALAGAGLVLGRAPSVARASGPVARAMALPDGAVPGGGRAGPVIRPGGTFDLVGLAGADLRGAGVQVRARRGGGPWSPWAPLGTGAAHGPDRPRGARAPASDPVWTGAADALQLRAARSAPGGHLHLVSVPAAGRRGASAATARAATAGGAPPIIPRAAWGAAQVPPRAGPSYGAVSLAFVHHTVSANTYAPEDSPRIVLAIAKYHRDTNGWNDIGYNFLVDRYGQVFEGRAGGIDRAVIGAQAGGWNSQSTGIATIGTFDADALPETAMSVLTRLIAWKLTLHGVPLGGTVELVSGGGQENRYPYGTHVTFTRVSGHRDGCKTDCPGAFLYGQLDDLRVRVAGQAAPAAPAASTTTAVVTLTADATHVRYGEATTLRGQVTLADASAGAGVPVSVQKQTSTGGWVRVASASTAADGTFTASLTWRIAGAVRAQAQVAGGRAQSAPLAVAVDRVVAVLAPLVQSRVVAGSAVAMRGTVGPSGPVRVQIERQDHATGRWRPAGQARGTVRGTGFTASVPLVKPALYRLTATSGAARAAPVFVRAVRPR